MSATEMDAAMDFNPDLLTTEQLTEVVNARLLDVCTKTFLATCKYSDFAQNLRESFASQFPSEDRSVPSPTLAAPLAGTLLSKHHCDTTEYRSKAYTALEGVRIALDIHEPIDCPPRSNTAMATDLNPVQVILMQRESIWNTMNEAREAIQNLYTTMGEMVIVDNVRQIYNAMFFDASNRLNSMCDNMHTWDTLLPWERQQRLENWRERQVLERRERRRRRRQLRNIRIGARFNRLSRPNPES